MHPTTPPTPSRRAPRAPKNPRRRVRSESDRKKHAGWRHCPRCARSVSTNGRNFYHHMHKCDRVFFADLIAKVDSAIAPVSTPLPPPVPRIQSSPITPTRTPKRTPVKMTEMQRVVFLQQLCFLRVYDRTVDAVLNQIEQSEASIFSSAAFEAVRRAKGVETPQRPFPRPKPFSPPFSPLAPPLHQSQPSRPAQDTFTSAPIPPQSNPVPNPGTVHPQSPPHVAIVNGTHVSSIPNGAPAMNPPYTSNASPNVSAALSGNNTHVLNVPPATSPHLTNSAPPVDNGPASIMLQGHGSMQRHPISSVSPSDRHLSQGLPIPASSSLPGTRPIPEQQVFPGKAVGNVIARNLIAPHRDGLHSRTIVSPDGRAVSETVGYAQHMNPAMPGVSIPLQTGSAIPTVSMHVQTGTSMPTVTIPARNGTVIPAVSVPVQSGTSMPVPVASVPMQIDASEEIPVSGTFAVPPPGRLDQRDQISRSGPLLSKTGLPSTQQAYGTPGNLGNNASVSHQNLGMRSSMNPAVGSNESWRRDAQRFPVSTGVAAYSEAPYSNTTLLPQPQGSGVLNMPGSAASVAATPVSRVASAMSISSVINT